MPSVLTLIAPPRNRATLVDDPEGRLVLENFQKGRITFLREPVAVEIHEDLLTGLWRFDNNYTEDLYAARFSSELLTFDADVNQAPYWDDTEDPDVVLVIPSDVDPETVNHAPYWDPTEDTETTLVRPPQYPPYWEPSEATRIELVIPAGAEVANRTPYWDSSESTLIILEIT